MLLTLGNQILSKHIYDKNCCSSSLTAGPLQSVMKQACSLCLLCCHLTVRRLPWWSFPNTFCSLGGKLQGSGLVTIFLRFCSHTIEGQCVIPLVKNVQAGKVRDNLGWGNGNLFNLHQMTWDARLLLSVIEDCHPKGRWNIWIQCAWNMWKRESCAEKSWWHFLSTYQGTGNGWAWSKPLNPHNHLEYYHSLWFQLVEIQPGSAHSSILCPLKATPPRVSGIFRVRWAHSFSCKSLWVLSLYQIP